MTEKELKRLSRAELLELLLVQTKEEEKLREELTEAQRKLNQQGLQIEKSDAANQVMLEANISSTDVKKELSRESYKKRYGRTFRSTVYLLITAAALAVLIATLWIPVLRIFGASMEPTLYDGEIVVSMKNSDFQQGDVVAFYYGNRILVKRYIAGPGSWVDIKEDGTVLVDGVELEEPYVSEKDFGECDLELPYQVPEDRYFLLGDHRATSVDSRHSLLGCVSEEQIVGKIVYRIWPLSVFGSVK